MKICENGRIRPMTRQELLAAAEAAAQERSRPFTEGEVLRMLMERQLGMLEVEPEQALRMRAFYPRWTAGKSYEAGCRVQLGDRLYQCLQTHTAQSGWEPEAAPALWTVLEARHTGTYADPIPYSGNLALEQGRYYSQEGVLYLCVRDTEAPVYHGLSALVGLYVEVAA